MPCSLWDSPLGRAICAFTKMRIHCRMAGHAHMAHDRALVLFPGLRAKMAYATKDGFCMGDMWNLAIPHLIPQAGKSTEADKLRPFCRKRRRKPHKHKCIPHTHGGYPCRVALAAMATPYSPYHGRPPGMTDCPDRRVYSLLWHMFA